MVNPFKRAPKVHTHDVVIYQGRVCEVTRMRRENNTVWCDVSDAESGRVFHAPVAVFT